MATLDFESGVPSIIKQADNNAWGISTDQADTGTQSLKSGNGAVDDSISFVFLMLDCPTGGTLDLRYLVSSESDFDFGKVVFNGVGVVQSSGNNTTWTSMPQQTLDTGENFIIIYFVKDGGSASNDDAMYIDNIVLPDDATDISADVNYDFSIFTNDATLPWVDSSDTDLTPFTDSQESPASAADDDTTTLEYDSPSSSAAGGVFFGGFGDSELNFDFCQFLIDDVNVFEDSGEATLMNSQARKDRYLTGYHGTVTSGTHNYKIRYTKDGGASSASDSTKAYAFYEPSLSGASPPSSFAVLRRRRQEG